MPKFSDQLIISTDASIDKDGIGAVLHIVRDGKLLLGGYFSASLKRSQVRFLPCELEALAISASVEHWGHFITQSKHVTQVYTDNMPCVLRALHSDFETTIFKEFRMKKN